MNCHPLHQLQSPSYSWLINVTLTPHFKVRITTAHLTTALTPAVLLFYFASQAIEIDPHQGNGGFVLWNMPTIERWWSAQGRSSLKRREKEICR